MTRFRKAIGFIHLWLGLISGLIVFIISVTGCIYVFQKEIGDIYYKKTFFVTPPADPVTLPYSTLLKTAGQVLGKDKPVTYSTTFKAPANAWEFMSYKPGNPKSLTYFGTVAHYESVFINPYTGKVTGTRDYKHDFFNVIKAIHWSLFLNDTYGQPIVGYSTLVFVFLLITGMIMWWPKKWSKTNINKSFKIKWGASFKRLNYDLHNVSGFYAMLIALVLALTGMVFAMKWFETTVYVVASRSITPPDIKYMKSALTDHPVERPVDIAFKTAKGLFPSMDRITVAPAAGKDAVIYISGIDDEEAFYHTDELQFDQYTGKLLYRRNYEEQNAGEKLVRMNYDIHVGAIWGLTGKILVLIGGLVSASLPVTGLIIWLNRKKKKKYSK